MLKVNLQVNKVFAPLWQCKTRYVCLKGSAGSGKSVDTAQFYITRLLTEPGRNLLCVRKVDLSNRHSTFAELQKAIVNLGVGKYFTTTQSPMKITCKVNQNEILFGGVNDDKQREKLKSITASHGKLTDIWIEEATELSHNDLDILDDRLRGILPDGLFYQIRLTFNPVSASHWIKTYFFDREDPDVTTHQSTYRDNPWCDKEYFRRMERRKELDPDGYRVYGLGEWGETGGLVFTNYFVKEISQKRTDYDHVQIGQDFGFNHADAILEIGLKDGEIYILREIYLKEKTTEEIIQEALKADIPKDVKMICDSAEPDRIITWKRAGFSAIPVHKFANSVKFAIDWLKQRKIYIHPDCVNTIKEISQWHWQKDKVTDGYTDEPVPFEDDAMAALRYGCSLWMPKDAQSLAPVVEQKPIINFNCEKPKPKHFGAGKVKIFK